LRRQQKELIDLRCHKRQTNSSSFTKEKVQNLLDGSFSSAQIAVIKNQLKRPRRWTKDDIVNGLMLRSFSRKSYEFLREKKLLPLPAQSTLQNWVRNFTCQPGLLHDIRKILQEYIESEDSPLSPLAVISFDEMEISQCLEYDQQSDRVFGPFKKLQLVIVRGLCSKWKQPIYFDFDTAMKKDLLLFIIRSVEEIGIRVYGTTFDLGNHGLLSSLGVTPDRPFFFNPADNNRKIFVFPDAPHLLKLCRNHLLDDGYQIDETTHLTKDNFERLLLADQSELKICPKLTTNHLDCQGNARQKVRPAAQLLSHTTATAFRCLFPEWKIEADWIDLINAWFDTMNSRLKFDSDPAKCAFGIHLEQQKEILMKTCEAIKKTRSLRHKGLLPFQRGILISSSALPQLFDDLHQNWNVQYIRTSCLNQDVSENFFSRIRALGITDDHPGDMYERVHKF
jgi:Transposase protein